MQKHLFRKKKKSRAEQRIEMCLLSQDISIPLLPAKCFDVSFKSYTFTFCHMNFPHYCCYTGIIMIKSSFFI